MTWQLILTSMRGEHYWRNQVFFLRTFLCKDVNITYLQHLRQVHSYSLCGGRWLSLHRPTSFTQASLKCGKIALVDVSWTRASVSCITLTHGGSSMMSCFALSVLLFLSDSTSWGSFEDWGESSPHVPGLNDSLTAFTFDLKINLWIWN